MAAAGPENLVPNGDFADGLKGWKVHFPEANEQNYARNHEWLQVTDGELLVTMPAKVAALAGVKAVSELIPVSGGPETELEFGAELFSEAPSVIIFIEAYQEDPERTEVGDNQYPGYVRSYRATIHVKAKKGEWATVRRTIKPFKRERYAPSHVLIKLFTYQSAGSVRFRRAFIHLNDPN